MTTVLSFEMLSEGIRDELPQVANVPKYATAATLQVNAGELFMVDIFNEEAIPTRAEVPARCLPNRADSNQRMHVKFQSKMSYFMAPEDSRSWFHQVQT